MRFVVKSVSCYADLMLKINWKIRKNKQEFQGYFVHWNTNVTATTMANFSSGTNI